MALMKCPECGRVDDCYDIEDDQYCGCGGLLETHFPSEDEDSE